MNKRRYETSVEGILRRDEEGFFLNPGFRVDSSVTRFTKSLKSPIDPEHLLGKRVRIRGMAEFRKEDVFPFSMEIHDVYVYPPESELPSLSDICGIFPDATGDLPSEEWVNNLRMESERDFS